MIFRGKKFLSHFSPKELEESSFSSDVPPSLEQVSSMRFPYIDMRNWIILIFSARSHRRVLYIGEKSIMTDYPLKYRLRLTALGYTVYSDTNRRASDSGASMIL